MATEHNIDATEPDELKQQFSINRKKNGLTYSCPKILEDNPIQNSEELRDHLILICGESDYIVSEELHKSGKRHYHAYLRSTNAVRTKNAAFFDFKGVHPNIIEPRKSGLGWQQYCAKDKKYITNFYEPQLSKALVYLKHKTFEEAREYALANMPQYLTHHAQIDNLYKKVKLMPKPVTTPYVFTTPLVDLTKSAMFIGPTGVHKTSFAKAHFKNPLFVRNKQKLSDLRPDHDGIIFDDMDFTCFTDQEQIHLLDIEDESDINIKYGGITIPAGMPRIFTTNYREIFNLRNLAILRRINFFVYKENIV